MYVAASIRDRLHTAAAAQETTYTELVLAALDATHETLADQFTAPAALTSGSLFTGRGQPQRRRNTEPSVQVSLRPLRDDLAVVDRLVRSTVAPSRSALVAVALDLYLPR